MPDITLIGVDELQRTLQRAGARARPMLAAAMYTEATYIMSKSVPLVPVDSGVLRGSATVQQPVMFGKIVRVRFGYGGAASKYALSVHENPRSGRTGGSSPSGQPYPSYAQSGQWKFLEAPALQLFPSSPQRMAVSLRTLFQ